MKMNRRTPTNNTKALWCALEIRTIGSKVLRASFISNRHRWRLRLVDRAVKSWVRAAWACIRAPVKAKWCSRRRWRPRRINSFIKTWTASINKTISTPTVSKETALTHRRNNSNSRVTPATQWWQEVIHSNLDSDNGEVGDDQAGANWGYTPSASPSSRQLSPDDSDGH